MPPGTLEDILRLLSNRENLSLLAALSVGPGYPRALAERLGRAESEVARRLKTLERANLVEGGWRRENGRNVRLYNVRARRFEVLLDREGVRVIAPALAQGPRLLPMVEQPPARRALFGREEELARLANRSAHLTILVGLPGMGKTSLAAEFAHRYRGRIVWHSLTPFHTARGLLETTARGIAPPSSRLARMFEPSGVDLADALRRVTLRLSRTRALVILDDYEKVRDDGVHEIVRRWQRELVTARLLVLSRTRPPLDLDARTQLIMLGGLRPEATRALLRSHGVDASDEELRRLQRVSGGHPLTLVLYSRHSGGEPDVAMTEVADLGRTAAEALDGPTRTVLLALAAVRRPLGLEALRFLTGIQDPGRPLVSLERRALVRSVGPAYVVHDVLRAALASLVDARRDLHRRAVDLFLASGRAEDVLEALYHAVRAGDFETVATLLEADLLEERHRLIDKGFLRGYLEVIDEVPVEALEPRHRALVRYGRARILTSIAPTSVAVREFLEARRLAETAGERRLLALILRELGAVLHNAGRRDEAERTFRRFLDLVERDRWTAQRGHALWALHRVYHQRGIMELAREFRQRALREARRSGDRNLLLEITTFCSMAWPKEWRRVMPSLRRRAALFEAHGEPRQVARVQAYLGEIACRSARWSGARAAAYAGEAFRYLEDAITALEALGDRREQANALAWRAYAHLLAGQLDRAEEGARAVLGMRRDLGPDHSAIQAHQVLASVRRARGHLRAARRSAEAAVREAFRFKCRCTGVVLLDRALIDEAMGRVWQSRRSLHRAVAEAVRRGYPDEARLARREAGLRGIHAG